MNTQGDDAQRKYDFTYDNAGRLTSALFNERQTTGDAWVHAKMDFSVTGTSGKISYDLNGNLLSMLQKGIVPGNATPVEIDNLQYTYTSLTNKLLKVVDNGTAATANGKQGDFSDGTNGAANDYVYDDNGNVVIDLNKNAKDLNNTPGANGIKYNFLDKPEQIRIAGKGLIQLIYDADGNKLQKLYTPEGGGITKTTSYVGGFVYEADNLQYLNFEEGRIRIMQAVSQNNGYDYLTMDGNIDMPGGKRGAYDYFLRDYQGNVRMILTEETEIGSNTATMESSRAANEEPLFGQVDASGTPTAANEIKARFSAASVSAWTHPNLGSSVSRVGKLAASKIGPNSLLKVMAGDKVSATTIYYYQNPVVNTAGTSTVADLLVSLGQAIAGGGATNGILHGAGTASSVTSQLNSTLPFTSLVSPDASSTVGDKPKAYLKVLFFDERFNFVEEGSSSLRVSHAGDGSDPLVLANIRAPKNGYALVYVSNESDEMVYFDNLQVTHERGQIVEEDHYYAYGLKIAGISSRKLPDPNEGSIENHYLYNDKELFEEADLDWYDYGFRSYDPQIGRFMQLDPLTDDFPYYTPYQYAGDEPVGNVDLDGLEPLSAINFANNLAEQGISSTTHFITTGRNAGKVSVGWVVNGIAHGRSFATTLIVSAPLIARVALPAAKAASNIAKINYNSVSRSPVMFPSSGAPGSGSSGSGAGQAAAAGFIGLNPELYPAAIATGGALAVAYIGYLALHPPQGTDANSSPMPGYVSRDNADYVPPSVFLNSNESLSRTELDISVLLMSQKKTFDELAGAFETELEKAQNQLEGITKAQEQAAKTKVDGQKKQTKIYKTDKSLQNLKKVLKDIKSSRDGKS